VERTHQIKDLSRKNEDVQTVHNLLHGCVQVPDVHVEYIDVGCTQLLQARFEAEFHGLGVVSQEELVLLNSWVA
jgi:hypothetical protein